MWGDTSHKIADPPQQLSDSLGSRHYHLLGAVWTDYHRRHLPGIAFFHSVKEETLQDVARRTLPSAQARRSSLDQESTGRLSGYKILRPFSQKRIPTLSRHKQSRQFFLSRRDWFLPKRSRLWSPSESPIISPDQETENATLEIQFFMKANPVPVTL
jgi:hypothetical protein